MREPLASTVRIARRAGGLTADPRRVPEEVPVAFSVSGTTHAVMMASPADLEDFAVGFCLTEGIAGSAADVEAVETVDLGEGVELRLTLAAPAARAFEARRRRLAGPVGCGLCGIESIEEALRGVRDVADNRLALDAAGVVRAVRALAERQPLHRATGAVHAAGFYRPGEGLVAAREDVGRHNALDKLAGALARGGQDGAGGAVVVTSRVSVEMVQKAAAIGAPIVVAVSAPTALALRTAEAAGMTLVALVRGEEFDIFTRPERIDPGADRHVA
ncbi:formate dehydrogenase accessory sulfurtransferase FdhD [Aquibium sp. A9E412]|uniref:formate dehydrogenase accessory sulfurtransferase FdhD n=1 Tax=Aquibium sp. A9E412 TaxID=2976767 RepID=UPI0025B2699F|nr:formate dehydrogenase accessory sulfurtransferase FdhD [Aquibium sp. A9E412]MDN2568042.1 formate dehydrogenase accessory sulfurtransferase FdhD [Aquibium sp. A9E412]